MKQLASRPSQATFNYWNPVQTVKVELDFVPLTHESEVKLPAVSGSSGRLGVERCPSEPTELDCPGRVFAEPDRDYGEVMAEFVATYWVAPAKAEVEPPDSSGWNCASERRSYPSPGWPFWSLWIIAVGNVSV